ncbi:hypothetical protein ACGF3G_29750 [Streptomyces sp. NPDC048179]|uniref:hypothetical protein n=1 Tax=Streptomyces sp. NPDC048179 TaxID=3365506 RepID=UPI003714DDFA
MCHQALVEWLSASTWERLRSDLLGLTTCLGSSGHGCKNVVPGMLCGRSPQQLGWLFVYDGERWGGIGSPSEESKGRLRRCGGCSRGEFG